MEMVRIFVLLEIMIYIFDVHVELMHACIHTLDTVTYVYIYIHIYI